MNWFRSALETPPSSIGFSKEEVIHAGEFLSFKNHPYYEKFLLTIQDLATKSGLDAKTSDAALISIGERGAYLNLIKFLRAEEHDTECILRASLTEKSYETSENVEDF